MAPVLVLRSFGGSMNSKEQKNIERLLVFTFHLCGSCLIILIAYTNNSYSLLATMCIPLQDKPGIVPVKKSGLLNSSVISLNAGYTIS